MTVQPGPLPQRIGDRERDQAVEYLRDHMAEGRLDQDEFEERLTTALTAKTQADLEPLFLDLPSPKPGQPTVPVLPQQPLSVQAVSGRSPYPVRINSRSRTALATASALIWPAMIMLMIATHGQILFFLFIPFLLPWLLGQGRRNDWRRR